jgi:hypothetical protein
MAASTGPVIAIGAITLVNTVVLNNGPDAPGQSPAVRIAVATTIGALGFAFWEKFMPRTATAVAWVALLTVLLVRLEPGKPAPLETLANWYSNT